MQTVRLSDHTDDEKAILRRAAAILRVDVADLPENTEPDLTEENLARAAHPQSAATHKHAQSHTSASASLSGPRIAEQAQNEFLQDLMVTLPTEVINDTNLSNYIMDGRENIDWYENCGIDWNNVSGDLELSEDLQESNTNLWLGNISDFSHGGPLNKTFANEFGTCESGLNELQQNLAQPSNNEVSSFNLGSMIYVSSISAPRAYQLNMIQVQAPQMHSVDFHMPSGSHQVVSTMIGSPQTSHLDPSVNIHAPLRCVRTNDLFMDTKAPHLQSSATANAPVTQLSDLDNAPFPLAACSTEKHSTRLPNPALSLRPQVSNPMFPVVTSITQHHNDTVTPATPHRVVTSVPECFYPIELQPVKKPRRQRARRGQEEGSRRKRTPFKDPEARRETARTRHERSCCIRCRMYKIRCDRNPSNPFGPCINCVWLRQPHPCLRSHTTISEVSLYRDQKRPYMRWTQRWQSMSMTNITKWASSEIRTIEITQKYGNARYKLRVRQFLPEPGDLLEESWTDGLNEKKHYIPPFGIVDMQETAQELLRYVDGNIGEFIKSTINPADKLIRNTFYMAFAHARETTHEDERRLLHNVLRLWVAARMTSTPETICGNENLGIETVDDASSPWYEGIPIPPVMCAQLEIVIFTALLQPWKKCVLGSLQEMIKFKERRHWFPVYLSLFILLHSCSLTTKRDYEYARQISLSQAYANHESIEAHHHGAKTILAHYHACKRGKQPFGINWDGPDWNALSDTPGITDQAQHYLKQTADLWKERVHRFDEVRKERNVRDESYFFSQLFDGEWSPDAQGTSSLLQ